MHFLQPRPCHFLYAFYEQVLTQQCNLVGKPTAFGRKIDLELKSANMLVMTTRDKFTTTDVTVFYSSK